MIKVHLVLKGYSICNTTDRDGGKQAVTSVNEFKCVDTAERCKKCEATLRKMGRM